MGWIRKHMTTLWRSAIVIAICCSVLFATWLLEGFATRFAIQEESKRAEASAILLESSFRRELEKFRMASVVLAKDPDAVAVLTNATPDSIAYLNGKFEGLSKEMQAASIYLLDEDGLALASSNWREPTSFVGKSYSFRAYFREGKSKGSHEQFALGNVSRRPGLYISRRIDTNLSRKGIVVIKVEFDQLEEEWRGYGKPAFVTNPAGVVLVTSKPDWRFKSIGRLTGEQQKSAASSRDFGEGEIVQLPIYAQNQVARIGARFDHAPKIVEAVKRPSSNWTVHVLADTQDVVAVAVYRTRILMLVTVLLLTSLFFIDLYRRRAIIARAELAASERVRDLNDRLAHSNKLSILGQIAAGVGHEINQPLATIGTYASSAILLNDQGATKSVRENLERIGKLTIRIGEITRELRTFSRKSPRRLETVELRAAIDSALLLLHERATDLQADIRVISETEGQTVMAYQGAVEQVIVNLVQNALDAGGMNTRIDIHIISNNKWHEISVRDYGPGLSPKAQAELFQPFSTSKQSGLGLGLVISRDLVAEFGGELSGGNCDPGCKFVVRLPLIGGSA